MKQPFSKTSRGIGIGLVLGIVFGILMDNVGLGIALGLALGAGASQYGSKRDDSNGRVTLCIHRSREAEYVASSRRT